MAEYTKVFDNPYPNGWENLPSETTPITAQALQEHTDAIEHIETYLDENPIKDATDVSWNQIEKSGTKIAEITIDGQKKDVYAPEGGSGASTWSEVANKPFESIGEGLTVENNVLKTNGEGGLPDLAGTKAEFDAIKDSLPDGSAFDTTDEDAEGNPLPVEIELYHNGVYKIACRGIGVGMTMQFPVFREPKSVTGEDVQYYKGTTSSSTWIDSSVDLWSWDSNILTVRFGNPPSEAGMYGTRGKIKITY